MSNLLGEKAQDKFNALEITPDPRHDLSLLLEAARCPQTVPCLLTTAIYLSGSASWHVRQKTKQYPLGVLFGENGVGKTSQMDVAARLITGQTESSKFNQLTDVRTLLHHVGMTTLPVTVEDSESKRKVFAQFWF